VPVKINPDPTIKIYDIDMFDNETSGAVQMLHGKGYRVICYLDVGSWEDWRDDAAAFRRVFLAVSTQGFLTITGWTSAM
jgi:hypothetical protein